MSEAVLRLFSALRALYAEERAEITHRLWESLPNIRDDLFADWDPDLYESIVNRIEHARQYDVVRLTPVGSLLCEQTLTLTDGERGDLAHLLWQSLPSMYGLFGEDDPAFVAELNRRITDLESGRTKGIPAEEVMRRFKEKYG